MVLAAAHSALLPCCPAACTALLGHCDQQGRFGTTAARVCFGCAACGTGIPVDCRHVVPTATAATACRPCSLAACTPWLLRTWALEDLGISGVGLRHDTGIVDAGSSSPEHGHAHEQA